MTPVDVIASLAAALMLAAAVAVEHRLVPGRSCPAATAGRAERPSRPSTPVRRRRRAPTDAEVALWCDRVARRVRAGDSVSVALRDVASSPPLRERLAPVVLALDRGHDVADAAAAVIAAPTRRSGPPSTDPVGTALTVVAAVARLGGPAAEPLDRVAAVLRQRHADADERRTQSAQARASALTLTILPLAVLALLAAGSTSTRGALASPLGLTVAAFGLALNALGWWWMRRIIARAAS